MEIGTLIEFGFHGRKLSISLLNKTDLFAKIRRSERRLRTFIKMHTAKWTGINIFIFYNNISFLFS